MRRLAIVALLLAAGCKQPPPEKLSPTPRAAGLDPSGLARYEAYEKALVAALAPLGSRADAGASLADEIDRTNQRLQAESGLPPQELHAWEALTVAVFRAQPLQDAGAPPERLSPAPEHDDLADQRRAFGDAAVDAVLAREPQLLQLHLARAQVLKKLTAAAGG